MTTVRDSFPQSLATLRKPVGVAIEATDVDHLVRLYPGWNGRFQQVTAGPFQAEIQMAQGGLLRVFRGMGTQSVLARGLGSEAWVDFSPVTSRNEQIRWQGRKRDPGQLVVRGPAVEIDNLTVRRTEVLTMSIRAVDIERAANSLLQTDAPLSRIGWCCRPVAPALLSRLDECLRRLLKTADRSQLPGAWDDEFLAVEQECLVAALAGLQCTKTPVHERLSRRAEIVRRGEEWLRDRLSESVVLMDLCAALGVSARTVQYAFCEQFGIGPIEYFRVLRLNAVRSALKRAARGDVTVREIALQYGFSHLGNFAADYRWQFGELPSETLRSRRG